MIDDDSNLSSRDHQLEVTADVELLREIAKPPVELTKEGEAKFRWSDDQLEVRSVDGANVMMVEQVVPTGIFESYEISCGGDEFVLGIPCNRLDSLLEAANDGESIEIVYNNETDKLDIHFDDVSYSLATVELDSIREPPRKQMEYSNHLKAHSRIFKKANKVIGIAGPAMTFEVGAGEARITGSGDTDDAELNLSVVEEGNQGSEDFDIILQKDNGKVDSRYGSNYIKKIPKFTPDGYVDVKISSSFPMEIVVRRANNRIFTQLRLAPRVDAMD